ncbi:MAG: EpsG family protein [Fusicatenibacter sp.]|nr:EpsG family protein [Fusicatenibacter sp.]
MTLTNYWWLLIWLFTGGLILAMAFPKQQEMILGKQEVRWTPLAALLLVLPYVVWAGFRKNFGDTPAYSRMYDLVPNTLRQIPEYLSVNTKDKGFSVLLTLFKMLFGDSKWIFFLIIAIFQMLCLVIIYRKYSEDYWISIFLFIASSDYLSWMHNGIRQFIAATAIFACFGLIIKKKYVPAICIILLASTIHASALMMIPVIFIVQGRALNRRSILVIVCAIIGIVFVDQLTPVLNDVLVDTQYSDLVTNELWSNDNGTNVIRVLVYSIPALLSIIGKKYIIAENNPVINICVNCSLITAGIYAVSSVSSGIYIGRLPIYTSL